jgi:hypothetical protein
MSGPQVIEYAPGERAPAPVPLPPIEQMYRTACATPSDINEHLPILRELASKCRHVTEFGLRWATGSTIAFLAAQPETFVSWDLEPTAVVSQQVLNLIRARGRTSFQPRCGDTLKIAPIEPTDLLFIDTLHTGKHLYAELKRHVEPRRSPLSVRKYLVFHDTQTFRYVGEDGQPGGLVDAIREFQLHHAWPHWELLHDFKNNNGLAVLAHICVDGHSKKRVNGHCVSCATVPPEGE